MNATNGLTAPARWSSLLALVLLIAPVEAQYTIQTIAGGGPPDGLAATNVGMSPYGLALDAAGNLYVASPVHQRIFKISPSGTVTTAAGNGAVGYPGNGLPATNAALQNALGVTVDRSGNIYIADSQNGRIRKVTTDGLVKTVAGGGPPSPNLGDGGLAVNATLASPRTVAVDDTGNLFISDLGNHRVRKVSIAGIITTVAGNGISGYSGDGGPATSASLSSVFAVALDSSGSLYIADWENGRIRRVSPGGVITTFAGNGISAYSGDGGLAISASLSHPEGVAFDNDGNLFIADTGNARVRKVSPAGVITTVAGIGIWTYSGDGGPATSAALHYPTGLVVDSSGSLYIGDSGNGRVRKVTNEIITTFAGTGHGLPWGDGGLATAAQLTRPEAVAYDEVGSLYIADAGNARVRKVTRDGIITTFAGNGTDTYAGDGGRAVDAAVSPKAIAVSAPGDVFIADIYNQRVRKVSPNGIITTVAGNGSFGFSGDGGPATSAKLNHPHSVATDRAGNLFIADTNNHRIRKVSPGGTISTVAGSGSPGYSGDGGTAATAQLREPRAIACDHAGNLYISDTGNQRIRKVSESGVITTIAGTGAQGYSGDGGPAINAQLEVPTSVAADTAGNLFISVYRRIRKVSPTGIITTVAGNGAFDFSGDGGAATSASISGASGVAIGSDGVIYVADTEANRIRTLMPPVLVQPAALAFVHHTGNSVPQPQTLTVSGPTAGTTSAVVVASGGWLSVSPAAAVGGSAFIVSVNVTGLAAGTYTGAIRLTAAKGSVDVPVTLTIPAACTIALSPSSVNVLPAGSTATLAISAPVGCPWTATSSVPWITISSSASGTGTGSVAYQVAANTGPTRTGSITFNGNLTFTISQFAPATYSAVRFVPISPCRAFDTRLTTRMSAGETRSFPLASTQCVIPPDVSAYSLNITAIPSGPLSYLTLWPTGQARPSVSTLNSFDGRIKANAAIVPAGINGALNVFVTDASDVVLDISGYFVSPDVLIDNFFRPVSFYPVTPCRIADTRLSTQIEARHTRTFSMASANCGIPNSSAVAYSLNLTAVPAAPLGYLTAWPNLGSQPFTSTLNAPTGAVTANAAIVTKGADSAISVYASDSTHLAVDINGYFAPPGNPGALSFHPVAPCRISDTRLPSGIFGGPIMAAGQKRTYPVPQSTCSIPATARAYSLNVTVVPQGSLAYLTLWPSDRPLPLVSTLNAFDGAVVSNAAIVPAAANGSINVFVTDTTHVILDINGYFE